MTRKEEIELATMQVGGVHPDWDALECFRVGYKEGAKWADKTMIEKICDFIIAFNERAKLGIIEPLINVEIFRKAMEE